MYIGLLFGLLACVCAECPVGKALKGLGIWCRIYGLGLMHGYNCPEPCSRAR